MLIDPDFAAIPLDAARALIRIPRTKSCIGTESAHGQSYTFEECTLRVMLPGMPANAALEVLTQCLQISVYKKNYGEVTFGRIIGKTPAVNRLIALFKDLSHAVPLFLKFTIGKESKSVLLSRAALGEIGTQVNSVDMSIVDNMKLFELPRHEEQSLTQLRQTVARCLPPGDEAADLRDLQPGEIFALGAEYEMCRQILIKGVRANFMAHKLNQARITELIESHHRFVECREIPNSPPDCQWVEFFIGDRIV